MQKRFAVHKRKKAADLTRPPYPVQLELRLEGHADTADDLVRVGVSGDHVAIFGLDIGPAEIVLHTAARFQVPGRAVSDLGGNAANHIDLGVLAALDA